MPSETKYIAIGRGASTVLALADEIGIPKDNCLSVVPFMDENQHFINPIWYDLNFRTDERKQQIGKELYKVSLSSEREILSFLADTKRIIVVCCLGSLSGLMAMPRILMMAKQYGITTHVVASKPFTWEGSQRTINAENSNRILQDNEIDSCIYEMDDALIGKDSNIPTKELFKIVDKKMLNLIRRVTVKYITIGMAACCDVRRAFPELEKTSDRILNVVTLDKESDEELFSSYTHPVSLSKELRLGKHISRDASKVPEISLRDVENFIKGSDFVLIILTAFEREEYTEAIEIIKLAKKAKVPFHVLVCRLPEFFCEHNHEFKLLEEQIESLTKNVTKSKIHCDILGQSIPAQITVPQLWEALYSLMQETIEKNIRG